ncbi:MAG: type II toxin-antitoxin system Phd/YefM family antitoxin [Candidatus Binataceae bacterium]
MRTVNIHEAKTHFSKLVERTARGGEVIIARAGKPIARLVPLKTGGKRRRLGPLAGKFRVPRDFDAPLPGEELAAFEGRGDARPR